MSTETSNPAQRLYDFLVAFRAEWLRINRGGRTGLQALRAYWERRYADSDAGRTDGNKRFVEWLATCLTLPQQVVELVENVGRPEQQFALPSLEQIADGFGTTLLTMNLNSNTWLNDTNLTRLEAVAQAFGFDPATAERTVPAEALEAILLLVERTLTEVQRADDLPEELRSFIVDALLDVQRAALSYSLSGSEGLVRALDRIAGNWYRSESVRDAVQGSEGSGVWKKVLAVLAGVSLVLSVTTQSIELAAHPDAPWNGVAPAQEIEKALPTQKALESGPVAELEVGNSVADADDR